MKIMPNDTISCLFVQHMQCFSLLEILLPRWLQPRQTFLADRSSLCSGLYSFAASAALLLTRHAVKHIDIVPLQLFPLPAVNHGDATEQLSFSTLVLLTIASQKSLQSEQLDEPGISRRE